MDNHQQYTDLSAINIRQLALGAHNDLCMFYNVAEAVGGLVIAKDGTLPTEFIVTMQHIKECVNGRQGTPGFHPHVLQSPHCLPLRTFGEMVANLYLLIRQGVHAESIISNATSAVAVNEPVATADKLPADVVKRLSAECISRHPSPDTTRLKALVDEQAQLAGVITAPKPSKPSKPSNVVSIFGRDRVTQH